MQLVILGTEDQKEELLSEGTAGGVQLIWLSDVHEFEQHTDGDVFIDLLFRNESSRIQLLQPLLPKPVIISSVIDTLEETHASFIRINGWPTLVKGAMMEGTCLNDDLKKEAGEALQLINKWIEWLPDEPGFVVPRVISTIVNEAYFALSEGVSTKEEIDVAMRLGTAYPYGPFEWSEKIGVQNIATLLLKLSSQQPRYTPCELLVQETNKAI